MFRRPVGRRGPSLLNTMATTAVIAGTASAVSGAVHGSQQKKAMAAQQQSAQTQQVQELQQQVSELQAQQQPAAAPAPAPAAAPDLITRLNQLAELKASGVLSDEEFAAAKAKLLAS